MANSNHTSAWESWFLTNPILKGESLGELPLSWLAWLRRAPAITTNADGEITLPDARDVQNVQTCSLRRTATTTASAAK